VTVGGIRATGGKEAHRRIDRGATTPAGIVAATFPGARRCRNNGGRIPTGGEDAVSAVWLRARTQLRGRARVTVLLTVLVGLAGGMVLAAVAGARRTEAALPRFQAYHRGSDATVEMFLSPAQRGPDPLGRELRALRGLPEVAGAARFRVAIVSSPDPASPMGRHRDLGLLPMDAGGSRLFGRPIVVAGRLADERQPDEAVVDEELAARRHLAVGSRWRVGAYTTSQLEQAAGETSTPPAGPVVDLRVVGIVRHPVDLLPAVTGQDNLFLNRGDLFLTPAYWQRHGPDLAGYGVVIVVALDRGEADLARLATDVRRLFGPDARVQPVHPDEGTTGATLGTIPGLRRAIRLEVGALLAFAALAAIAALLLLGQSLGRQVFLESVEYPTLRAVGMTRGQLVAVALVRAAVIGVGGAAVALAVAVALSPLAPIGLARRAELDPGISADWTVLVPGGLAVAVLVAACAGVAAWRASRSPLGSVGVVEAVPAGRPSRVAGALAAAGLPPTAVTGARLALERGRGRTAVPVHAAIAGAAAAVCVLAAAGVFSASLARLVGAPAAYGWTWDVSVGNFASRQEVRRAARVLDAAPAVDGYVGVGAGELLVDGEAVEVMAVERGRGSVPLGVLDGREPVRPEEIALGAATMRTLGKRLGDSVTVAGREPGKPSQRLRVVGRMVLSAGPLDTAITPGRGAVVDFEVVRRQYPGDVPQVFLVRLDPAADRARAIDMLQRRFPGSVVRPLPHPDIETVRRVGYLPALLAALVALLAVGTVTHALVSSVRRRRRDLAVLKTLGFLPRQVSATIAWQATAFAAAAVLAGLPLGVAVGRWAWRLVATQLGVVPKPVVPPLQAVAIVTGVLVAANVIAAGPGWVAGRVRPGLVLRSE
jgi:ABC-type lipoprotein release transport system permease subunit